MIDLTRARTCQSCAHSDRHGKDVNLRVCRRYPPTPELIPGPTGQPIQVNLWPPVSRGDWCGEHAWKKEPATARDLTIETKD